MTKTIRTTPDRPDCAGWHEADITCDGSEKERPCAYRSRCLAVISIAGGKARRTPDNINEVLGEWDEDRLDEYLAEQAAELMALPTPEVPAEEPERRVVVQPPPLPPKAPRRPPTAPATVFDSAMPIPGFGDPVKKHRPLADIYPPPTANFPHVLPIVDSIATRLATELGRKLVNEKDRGMRVGDFFLRYSSGMKGRTIGFYEATERNTYRHRLLCRFILTHRNPVLNIKTNCTDLALAIAQKPPSGVQCRMWRDSKPTVTLVSVDAAIVRDVVGWLGRLYNCHLLEGQV